MRTINCTPAELPDAIADDTLIIVGPGEIPAFTRHANNCQIVGTEGTVARGTITIDGGSVTVRRIRFEGAASGLAFTSNRQNVFHYGCVSDCEWIGSDKPLMCQASDGPMPPYFGAFRCTMRECFRAHNNSGIGVSAANWRVEGLVCRDSGFGDRSHAVYSLDGGGAGAVEDSFFWNCNVSNAVQLRSGGAYKDCLTIGVGAAVASRGTVTVAGNVDIGGTAYPDGQSGVFAQLTGKDGSRAVVGSNVVAGVAARQAGITIEGDHSIAQIGNNSLFDAGGAGGRGVRYVSDFRGRVQHLGNAIRQAVGPAIILDRSIAIDVSGDRWDSTQGEAAGQRMPIDQFRQFVGGGAVLDSVPTPDLSVEAWGGNLETDWRAYREWVREMVGVQ